ncbi:glycosyltransferase involved in cell wall biosynthesis [Bradyrhizobium sp. USDA 3311]
MENDTVGNMPLVRTTTLGSARQAVEIAHGPSVKGTMPAPTTGQLRVCHIAATTEGAAWVFEQVRDLRDRFGYDVSVILNGTSGALVDRFNAAGIRVLASDFQFLGGGDLFALPKRILDLEHILERERFDIIQTHLFHSMVIGRIAAWLADVPVRLSMIAGPFHLEAYTPSWIDGSTQWMDTALIPSCEFSRSLYLSMGVRKQRLEVIYYGPDETRFEPSREVAADLRAEHGWAADAPLIGMVAYFYPELGVNRWTPPAAQGRPVKSHVDLIRAMPAVLAEFPNAKLLLVGSGWEEGGRQYMAKMQALVAELGLSDSVVFTGYRTDIPAVLKSLDVAVQASVSENLGGSIEGLLMECPMVATRVGGLVDSVIDGHTGVLVGPADPAELARGILELLRDPSRAREFGRHGRARMLERFTLRTTVEDEHRLYQRLYARAPAGYRSVRRAFRLFCGALVGGYLAFRYTVFDSNLLPAWDAGWRPWHFLALRRLMLRLINAVLRSRTASAPAPYAAAPANEQFISVTIEPPAPIAPRLRLAGRMMLYRFYAFVGRQKLGWGLRRRLRAKFRRLLGSAAEPDSEARDR